MYYCAFAEIIQSLSMLHGYSFNFKAVAIFSRVVILSVSVAVAVVSL